jgi:hypothetical protein
MASPEDAKSSASPASALLLPECNTTPTPYRLDTTAPAALAALLDTFHLMQPRVHPVLERCVQSIALGVNAVRFAGGFPERAQSAIRRVRRHLTKTHLTMTTDLWRWSWQMSRRKTPLSANTRLSQTNCASSLISRKVSAYPLRTTLRAY